MSNIRKICEELYRKNRSNKEQLPKAQALGRMDRPKVMVQQDRKQDLDIASCIPPHVARLREKADPRHAEQRDRIALAAGKRIFGPELMTAGMLDIQNKANSLHSMDVDYDDYDFSSSHDYTTGASIEDTF